MPDPAPAPIPVSNHPPTSPPPGQFEPEKQPKPPGDPASGPSGRGHTSSSEELDPAQSSPATNGSGSLRGAAAPTKKRPPSLARQAWNLARSLADFVADGCKTVTAEQYQARLEICDGCEHRRSNRCMKCGCRLSLKAQGRAFQCPEAKWPAADCPE